MLFQCDMNCMIRGGRWTSVSVTWSELKRGLKCTNSQTGSVCVVSYVCTLYTHTHTVGFSQFWRSSSIRVPAHQCLCTAVESCTMLCLAKKTRACDKSVVVGCTRNIWFESLAWIRKKSTLALVFDDSTPLYLRTREHDVALRYVALRCVALRRLVTNYAAPLRTNGKKRSASFCPFLFYKHSDLSRLPPRFCPVH